METVAGAQPANPGSLGEVQKQPRWHLIVQIVAVVAITVGVAVALYLQHSTIGDGLRQLGKIKWRWVVVAGLSEVVSMVALSLLYWDLCAPTRPD